MHPSKICLHTLSDRHAWSGHNNMSACNPVQYSCNKYWLYAISWETGLSGVLGIPKTHHPITIAKDCWSAPSQTAFNFNALLMKLFFTPFQSLAGCTVMKASQSPPPPEGSPLSVALCPGWPHIQMGGIFTGRVHPTEGRSLSRAAHPHFAAGGFRKFGAVCIIGTEICVNWRLQCLKSKEIVTLRQCLIEIFTVY